MTIKSTTVGKNPLEEMEPKWEQQPPVDVTGVGSKSNAIKNNIAKEPGMLGPWIKVN